MFWKRLSQILLLTAQSCHPHPQLLQCLNTDFSSELSGLLLFLAVSCWGCVVLAQGAGEDRRKPEPFSVSFHFPNVCRCGALCSGTTGGRLLCQNEWCHMAALRKEQHRIAHLCCWLLACGRVQCVPLAEFEMPGKWQRCLQRKSWWYQERWDSLAFFLNYIYVSVCLPACLSCMLQCACGSQKTTWGVDSLLPPRMLPPPGVELMLLGLTASSFTHEPSHQPRYHSFLKQMSWYRRTQ